MTTIAANVATNVATVTERALVVTQAWLTYPTAALLALCAAGCEIHTYDSDGHYVSGPYDGTLTIDWSLDDSFDPDACDDYDARYIELAIYEGRDEVALLQPRCDDFEISIDLPDGEYSLDATLLDRSERAVSTTLSLDDIDVYEDLETPISIDFPLDSQL
jgi:hypothetical protein